MNFTNVNIKEFIDYVITFNNVDEIPVTFFESLTKGEAMQALQ